MPRPVHFEIHADDIGRAKKFYTQLFGWTFTASGDGGYQLISTGEGRGIDGGMIERRGPRPQGGQPVTSFVCTVDVPDLDQFLATAIAEGAATAVPKMPIPGVGWLAYITDTEGNILGMMEEDTSAA